MTYNQYLFSCLLKLYNVEFEQLEYDQQFDEIGENYIEFQNSVFNTFSMSEYDCIIQFLKAKYNK